MPQHTRQRIVHILEQRECASAQDLSRLLQVTPSNIRHHLSILIEQGSVKQIGHKENSPRGRPTALYALTQVNSKNNLDLISSILLDRLYGESSISADQDILRWLAQRITDQFPQTLHNPTKRLYDSIKFLDRLNYQAKWEAHLDSPRIMLGHCPYASIINEHPELCQMDIYLIEILSGEQAALISRRSVTSTGAHHCVFRIIKK